MHFKAMDSQYAQIHITNNMLDEYMLRATYTIHYCVTRLTTLCCVAARRHGVHAAGLSRQQPYLRQSRYIIYMYCVWTVQNTSPTYLSTYQYNNIQVLKCQNGFNKSGIYESHLYNTLLCNEIDYIVLRGSQTAWSTCRRFISTATIPQIVQVHYIHVLCMDCIEYKSHLSINISI